MFGLLEGAKPWEIGLLVLLALLLFGAKRLPEAGRSLGRSLREFRSGLKGGADEADEEEDEKKQSAKSRPKEE